jgi:hypothetical protein
LAITGFNLKTMHQMAAHVARRPVEVVCLGYPDMMVSDQEIGETFGAEVLSQVTYRADSAQIIKWHNWNQPGGRVPETVHFMSLLGMKATVLDISVSRGFEIVQDLNGPLAPELIDRFDIIFDGGTMEHCFNIGQVVTNFLSMTRVGGFIYHNNPFNVSNHGFYNFNPTFYQDFYVDNGHEIVGDMIAYRHVGGAYHFTKLPATTRFKWPEGEAWISAIARKRHAQPPRWPMQTKYKANPTLSG